MLLNLGKVHNKVIKRHWRYSDMTKSKCVNLNMTIK